MNRLIRQALACLILALLLPLLSIARAAPAAGALPAPFDVAILKTHANLHPRLYLTPQGIAALRQSIQTTHASLWATVRAQADAAVRSGPPAYILQDGHSGDEQLWQRQVGNVMPTLAMAYVLTGDRQYLDSAKAWALASCGYKTWGLNRYDGMDLATGHQLFGLAIIYDWCYADLDQPTRQTIRDTLARRAGAMYTACQQRKTYWYRQYLQNHLWVNITGMAAAGLALFDDPTIGDEPLKWLTFIDAAYQHTMESLGDDGASHEGVGYWEYGVEYMLKYMALSRQLMGINLYNNPWWRHTADYGLYLTLPRAAWTRGNCIVDIGDNPRGHWYGPEHLLRALAAEYHDGHAQWHAQQIDAASISAPSATWLNLLWFDPAVAPTPPTDLPTLHHFTDMGIVSARSDWSGQESLAVFKCGPFIGHKAVDQFTFDPGGGHVHPDANHFVLFGAGQWLIGDDGYRAKFTDNHNTLLVDSQGQLGQGKMWFNGREPLTAKAHPRILTASSTPAFDHIAGDATEAYSRQIGLRRYVRHLLFLKPDVLIVIDDIQTARPADLELRFHPQATSAQPQDQALLMAVKNANLRFEVLTPDDAKLSAAMIPTPGRTGEKTTDLFTIRLTVHRDQWRNATALAWSRSSPAPTVTLERSPTLWTFHTGARHISFDWNTGTVSAP